MALSLSLASLFVCDSFYSGPSSRDLFPFKFGKVDETAGARPRRAPIKEKRVNDRVTLGRCVAAKRRRPPDEKAELMVQMTDCSECASPKNSESCLIGGSCFIRYPVIRPENRSRGHRPERTIHRVGIKVGSFTLW